MATYLVTGGAGFIGSHIVEALIAQGKRTRVLDNFSTGHVQNLALFQEQIDLVEGDLLDPDVLERALDGIEVVFHQAALASVPRSIARPLDSHAACVTGTLMLLDAARQAGVRRVVFASSSSVYGDQPTPSKVETLMPAPISPYAAAKLAGEFYCQAFAASYGLETVAIRYFNVYGPRQDPASEYAAVIPKFVTTMIEGNQPTIFGDGRQSRDFTYIDNVVRGNLLAAEAPQAVGRTMNVASGRQHDLIELVATINEVLGTNIEPQFTEPRAGDVRDSLADITLARELMGYEPTIDFAAGLSRSIEYYRQLLAANE